VFVPWELSKQYDVLLDETAGWVVTLTGKKPTTVEFIGVLQSLNRVKIRAGHYAGAESAWLLNVTFIQGYRFHRSDALVSSIAAKRSILELQVHDRRCVQRQVCAY
jgi:hypothetical protein